MKKSVWVVVGLMLMSGGASIAQARSCGCCSYQGSLFMCERNCQGNTSCQMDCQEFYSKCHHKKHMHRHCRYS